MSEAADREAETGMCSSEWERSMEGCSHGGMCDSLSVLWKSVRGLFPGSSELLVAAVGESSEMHSDKGFASNYTSERRSVERSAELRGERRSLYPLRVFPLFVRYQRGGKGAREVRRGQREIDSVDVYGAGSSRWFRILD